MNATKTQSLTSMAQSLAAARFGAPLNIPESLIYTAVMDCADLLAASEQDLADAIKEIKRRTNRSLPSDSDQIPERLSVMWQNSRQTRHGWEVPIQVASADPRVGAGNVIAIIRLGGPGGLYSTKEAVEATAEAIVRAYNDARAR